MSLRSRHPAAARSKANPLLPPVPWFLCSGCLLLTYGVNGAGTSSVVAQCTGCEQSFVAGPADETQALRFASDGRERLDLTPANRHNYPLDDMTIAFWVSSKLNSPASNSPPCMANKSFPSLTGIPADPSVIRLGTAMAWSRRFTVTVKEA